MRPRLNDNAEWTAYRKWISIFLAIIVAYITLEFVFNAMLLNVSSGYGTDEDEFHRVETFGRVLASIGCTIALFGIFSAKLRGKKEFSLKGAITSFAIALGTIGPTFYVASEAIIEEGLVQRSSGEARYNAMSLDLMKRLLVTGVGSSGYWFHDDMVENPHHPQAMTYLAAYPIFGMTSEHTRSYLEKNAAKQARAFAEGIQTYSGVHGLEAAPGLFDAYQTYEPDLEETYREYMEASREASSKIRGISDSEFNELWSSLRDELRSNWAKLEPVMKKAMESAEWEVNHQTKGLMNIYQSALQRKYDHTLERIETEEYTKKYITRRGLYGRVISAGKPNDYIATLEKGVPGNPYTDICGGKGRIGKSCRPTRAQMYQHLWDYANMDFYATKHSAGWPVTTQTYSDFLATERVGNEVRSRIQSRLRITLPQEFVAEFKGSPDVTRRYIDQAIQRKGMREWLSAFSQASAIPLPDLDALVPNMSFQEFIQVKGIKEKIEDITGGFFSDQLNLNMQRDAFYSNVVTDSVNTNASNMLARYTRPQQDYVTKEAAIEDGKSAYRLAVVPPIALVLSMFFSLVAIFKLPLLVSELVYAKTGGEKDYRMHAMVVLALGAGLVVFLPFIAAPFDSLPEKMQGSIYGMSNTSAFLAYAMHWLLVVEPVLYGVGQTILEATGLNNLTLVHRSMHGM